MKIHNILYQFQFDAHHFNVVCNRNIYYIIGSDECKSIQRLSLGNGHPSNINYFIRLFFIYKHTYHEGCKRYLTYLGQPTKMTRQP